MHPDQRPDQPRTSPAVSAAGPSRPPGTAALPLGADPVGVGGPSQLPAEMDPRRPRPAGGWPGRPAAPAASTGPGTSRLPDRGRRRRWAVLAGWAVLWCVLVSAHGGYSWFYFDHGSVLLFGGHPRGLTAAGGLHLYRNYPQYQIGPLTFLVAALIQPFGVVAAQLLMVSVGVAIVVAAERLVAAPASVRTGVRLLGAELLFVPLWAELAVHYAHLDDVLVLALSVAAVTALAAGGSVGSVRCSGRRSARNRGRRRSCRCCGSFRPGTAGPRWGWAVAVPVLAWLPFLLADPGTLLATSKFTICNAKDSGLRALGVTDARTPSWCRPAQLALGLGVGAWSIRLGRWPNVLLAGVAARLLLDPGTYDYYTASVMVAALLADVMLRRGSWPTTSLVAFTGLYGVHLLNLPPTLALSV